MLKSLCQTWQRLQGLPQQNEALHHQGDALAGVALPLGKGPQCQLTAHPAVQQARWPCKVQTGRRAAQQTDGCVQVDCTPSKEAAVSLRGRADCTFCRTVFGCCLTE